MELDHEFTVPVPVGHAWPVLLDVERVAPCMPGATLDSIDDDEFTGRLKVRLGAMTITYRGSARFTGRDESARTVTIEGTGKEARGSGTASATVQAQLHDEGEQTRVTVHTKLNVTGRPAQFGRGILSEVGGKLVKRFADNLAAELARDQKPAEAAGSGDTGAPTAPPITTPAPPVGGPAGAADTPPPAPAAESAATAAPGADTAQDAEANEAGAAEGARVAAESGTGTGAPAGATARAEARPAAPATGSGATAERAPRERRHRPAAEAIDLLEVAGPSIAKRVGPVLAGLAVLWTVWRLLRRK